MRASISFSLVIAVVLFAVAVRAEKETVEDAGVGENTGPDDSAPPPNNFAGFETWNLQNGMRVWFKRIEGAPTVRVQIVLPVGSAQDYPGYAGIAHVVEHMVFASATGGQMDVESARDGTAANTRGYSTTFFIDVPSAEWEQGLRSMLDLLFGHRFDSSNLARVRDTIIAEGDLKPGSDSSGWRFFPGSFEYPDWYEREFGFIPKPYPTIGTYESIQNIAGPVTEMFHTNFYVPTNMLLTVIGDVPAAAVKKLVLEEFGAAGAQDEPRVPTGVLGRFRTAVDPGRYRKEIGYQEGAALVEVRLHYKLYDLTAEDVLTLQLLSHLLEMHIHDKLYYELRAAYSVEAKFRWFAGHGTISIGGDVLPGKFDDAHEAIEDAIADLSSGEMEPARFQALKKRAIDGLRMSDQSPQTMSDWARDYLDCGPFLDFPDVIAFWEKVDQKAVADYCQRRLVRERLVETIIRPASDATPVAIALSLAFILLALGVKRLVVKPAQMARLRYAARFRYSIPYLALAGVAAFFGCSVLYEITKAAYVQLLLVFLESWDCEVGRKAIELSIFYGTYFLVVLTALMLIPRKLLLFEHEWRVKFWLWRSKVYRCEDIQEIREERFWELLLSRRIFTSLVLHWGLWRKGVYLRTGKRFAWFFRARDNAELVKMLELGKRGRLEEQTAPFLDERHRDI